MRSVTPAEEALLDTLRDGCMYCGKPFARGVKVYVFGVSWCHADHDANHRCVIDSLDAAPQPSTLQPQPVY